ncbi:MAG: flavodoxin domain-containing protein [Actinomycetota bacterium]
MTQTRVLVAYATKNGSTGEIAATIAEAIRGAGMEADVKEVGAVKSVAPYEIVVIGSALYMDRWRREAVRFLRKFASELGRHEVWLFDSGPLDRSAETESKPIPRNVEELAQKVGSLGHATFGGKLNETAKGRIARAMVKQGRGGDFRSVEQIRAWANEIVKHEQWVTG